MGKSHAARFAHFLLEPTDAILSWALEVTVSALDLVPILRQHRPFAIYSSIALALLYTEEAWSSHNSWPNRPFNEAVVLTVVATAIALGGYLVSFLVPPLLVAETWDHPRAWGVLSNVTAWSVGITIAINVIEYVLLLYLVNFDLAASSILLRDIYAYTLLAMVFFHGLLLYVRYMQHLYQTPGFVQPAKVITASAGVGVIVPAVGSFLFFLDFYRLANAPLSDQAALSLHVYVRALYALTLVLAAYAWHLRWIADH